VNEVRNDVPDQELLTRYGCGHWFESLVVAQRQQLGRNLKRSVEGREAASALIELAWSSVAAPPIAPLQDVLNLGNDARMNLPGRAGCNWRWRFIEKMLTPEAIAWLGDLTQASKRTLSQCHDLTERQVA